MPLQNRDLFSGILCLPAFKKSFHEFTVTEHGSFPIMAFLKFFNSVLQLMLAACMSQLLLCNTFKKFSHRPRKIVSKFLVVPFGPAQVSMEFGSETSIKEANRTINLIFNFLGFGITLRK